MSTTSFSESKKADFDFSKSFEDTRDCNDCGDTFDNSTSVHFEGFDKKQKKYIKKTIACTEEDICDLREADRLLFYRTDLLLSQLNQQNCCLTTRVVQLERLLALFVIRTANIEKHLGIEIDELQAQVNPSQVTHSQQNPNPPQHDVDPMRALLAARYLQQGVIGGCGLNR